MYGLSGGKVRETISWYGLVQRSGWSGSCHLLFQVASLRRDRISKNVNYFYSWWISTLEPEDDNISPLLFPSGAMWFTTRPPVWLKFKLILTGLFLIRKNILSFEQLVCDCYRTKRHQKRMEQKTDCILHAFKEDHYEKWDSMRHILYYGNSCCSFVQCLQQWKETYSARQLPCQRL